MITEITRVTCDKCGQVAEDKFQDWTRYGNQTGVYIHRLAALGWRFVYGPSWKIERVECVKCSRPKLPARYNRQWR